MEHPSPPGRLARAIARIDEANDADPNVLVVDGARRPKERVHAEMVSRWVEHLRPDASEALRLAARAHHVRRWKIPRGSRPAGREAYLRWRADLHEFHAREAAEILREVGYDEAVVARVGDLVRKKNLKGDPEAQTLEDAIALVFLTTQLADLTARLDDEKVVGALRKTWRKMSDAGRAAATALPLGDRARALIARATRDARGRTSS